MHVTDYQIAQYIERKLTGSAKSRFERHVSECPECTESIASAYTLLNKIDNTPVHFPDSETLRKSQQLVRHRSYLLTDLFRFRIAGAAAVVIAVFGILFYFLFLDATEPELFRSTPDKQSLELLGPADGAVIKNTQLELYWKGDNHILLYSAVILSEDGTRLFEVETDTARVVISGKEYLEPGKRYFWRVEGILRDGTAIRSDMKVFTYRPH